jgi:hypothetical protein
VATRGFGGSIIEKHKLQDVYFHLCVFLITQYGQRIVIGGRGQPGLAALHNY